MIDVPIDAIQDRFDHEIHPQSASQCQQSNNASQFLKEIRDRPHLGLPKVTANVTVK